MKWHTARRASVDLGAPISVRYRKYVPADVDYCGGAFAPSPRWIADRMRASAERVQRVKGAALAAPLAAPVPQATSVHETMAAGSVVALIILAALLDYMSIGPNSIRDRVAFLMAWPAFYAGFSGSPLAAWTTNMLSSWIDGIKHSAGGAYWARVGTLWTVGLIVSIVFIYCVGVLMPVRWATRLGPWARMAFGGTAGGGEFGEAGGIMMRLNWRLWGCAFFLGMLGDLPGGWAGSAMRGMLTVLSPLMAFLPNLIFGGGQ